MGRPSAKIRRLCTRENLYGGRLGRSGFFVLQVALGDDHDLHVPREGSNLLNQIA
jgi:hypothetical protein